ncbi:MAG: hypothetical protein IJB83_02340 [Bacilli bacterium]|nr:hypothetical protein [Bacilli bacterium]
MRSLAGGVLAEIDIRKGINEFYICKDLLEIKDKLLESLSEIIDLSMYDINANSEQILLTIKKEIFNKNINKLIDQLYEKTPLKYTMYHLYKENKYSFSIKKDNKEKHNIKMIKLNNNIRIQEGKEIDELDTPYEYYYHRALTKEDIVKYIKTYVSFVKICGQAEYFESEDEIHMLYLLNAFSRGYIKDNLLYKSFLFYISG